MIPINGMNMIVPIAQEGETFMDIEKVWRRLFHKPPKSLEDLKRLCKEEHCSPINAKKCQECIYIREWWNYFEF